MVLDVGLSIEGSRNLMTHTSAPKFVEDVVVKVM
jgi:hypothetical protein